jgi:hypothetical protein
MLLKNHKQSTRADFVSEQRAATRPRYMMSLYRTVRMRIRRRMCVPLQGNKGQGGAFTK